jgi:hypothetical protein
MRVIKMHSQQKECSMEKDMMQIYLYDAADKIHKAGKDAIIGFAEGDDQRMLLMGLKRFTKVNAFNTKEARRRIVAGLRQKGKYPL